MKKQSTGRKTPVKNVTKKGAPSTQPLLPGMEHISRDDAMFLQNDINVALFGPGGQNDIQATGYGTQLSQLSTLWKNCRWEFISNIRSLLSEVYVEHGLIQTAIDVPVDDALRGGITIKSSQLSPKDIMMLSSRIEREEDLVQHSQALKWNGLFGGAAILIITDQDPSTELNIEELEGKSLEFRAIDMWELFYSLVNTTNPATFGAVQVDQINNVEFYDYYGISVHKSRVIRMVGIPAPSLIRPRLRGWGFSKVESIVQSINQYLKSKNLTFEVLDEFKVDIFKIRGFNESLRSASGIAAIQRRASVANRQKNFLNTLTLDKDDDYDSKQLSFAGIAEILKEIRIQIASDLRMPLTKLFGVSAAGFNSGEDDLEVYNTRVESEVRAKCKFNIVKTVELRCMQMFGFIPDDLTINFAPLRVMSSEQEEATKTAKFNRVLQARQAGEITSEEFRDACNVDELLPIELKKQNMLDLEEQVITEQPDTSPVPVMKKETSQVDAKPAKMAKDPRDPKQ